MADDIRVGDIGTPIIVTLVDETGAAVDVSGATEMVILLQPPDKTLIEKTAEHVTDGTDGKIQYVTIDGDLSQPKKWLMQARVTLPTGTWSSSTTSFTVLPNLAAA